MEQVNAEQEHNHENHFWHYLSLAGGGVTAAVVAAPYVGNLFNIGKPVMGVMMQPELMQKVGLATSVNNFLKDVPLVGDFLSSGGWQVGLTAGVIGIDRKSVV